MERGDAKRLRAGEDENGAGNEKRFEKCFLFLFGKDHDACPLRKMTTLRGEGYSNECVEHALQSYDRDSERKTKPSYAGLPRFHTPRRTGHCACLRTATLPAWRVCTQEADTTSCAAVSML